MLKLLKSSPTPRHLLLVTCCCFSFEILTVPIHTPCRGLKLASTWGGDSLIGATVYLHLKTNATTTTMHKMENWGQNTCHLHLFLKFNPLFTGQVREEVDVLVLLPLKPHARSQVLFAFHSPFLSMPCEGECWGFQPSVGASRGGMLCWHLPQSIMQLQKCPRYPSQATQIDKMLANVGFGPHLPIKFAWRFNALSPFGINLLDYNHFFSLEEFPWKQQWILQLLSYSHSWTHLVAF